MMVYQAISGPTMVFYTFDWTATPPTYVAYSYISGIDQSGIQSRIIISSSKWYFAGSKIWNFDTNF